MLRMHVPRFRLFALLVMGAFGASSPAHANDEGFGGVLSSTTDTPSNETDTVTSEASPPETVPENAAGRSVPATNALTRTQTPFATALESARATQERTPLVTLREKVRALDDETVRADAALRTGTIDEAVRDAAHAAYAAEKALLDDVEMMALRLRERCLRARGESATLPGLLPRGVRVSRDTEAIGMLLAFPDMKDCDRQVLVDDDVIARMTRLHEIERMVPDMGYHRLAERRALEAERDVLLDDLMGRTDDRPVKLQFTSKRHDAAATMEKLRPRGTLDDARGKNPGPVSPIR